MDVVADDNPGERMNDAAAPFFKLWLPSKGMMPEAEALDDLARKLKEKTATRSLKDKELNVDAPGIKRRMMKVAGKAGGPDGRKAAKLAQMPL